MIPFGHSLSGRQKQSGLKSFKFNSYKAFYLEEKKNAYQQVQRKTSCYAQTMMEGFNALTKISFSCNVIASI